MAVALWAVRLDRPMTEEECERLQLLLPPQRRKRWEQLKNARKRQEVLCAYALLQKALRERCGWTHLPQMDSASSGKPYFPEHPKLCFSISHTDGAALVGISDSAVGVDIEKIRPIPPRVMQRVARTEEEEAFFRCWVRREARGKRNGDGVGGMLYTEPPLQQGESYAQLEICPGYVAGVAATGEVELGQLTCYTVDDIV